MDLYAKIGRNWIITFFEGGFVFKKINLGTEQILIVSCIMFTVLFCQFFVRHAVDQP